MKLRLSKKRKAGTYHSGGLGASRGWPHKPLAGFLSVICLRYGTSAEVKILGTLILLPHEHQYPVNLPGFRLFEPTHT